MRISDWSSDVCSSDLRTPVDIPMDVLSRRDVSMADRLLAAVPQGRHAILWAHDAHVARQNTPYGFGWNSMGSRLNHVLGPEDYRTVTFSARRLDFNSKGVVRAGGNGGDPTRTVAAWRYDPGPSALGHLPSRSDIDRKRAES